MASDGDPVLGAGRWRVALDPKERLSLCIEAPGRLDLRAMLGMHCPRQLAQYPQRTVSRLGIVLSIVGTDF